MKALYMVIKATLMQFENLPKSLSPNENNVEDFIL